MRKIVNIDIDESIMKKNEIDEFVEKKILMDFLEFKNKNELLYCSLYDEGISSNERLIVWTTTKKVSNSLLDIVDINKIQDIKKEFLLDGKMECRVSKITCSENTHIIEFSFPILYKINTY